MDKKRSKTGNFRLGSPDEQPAALPPREEIERKLAQVGGQEPLPEGETPRRQRRPFTTALTPENRAGLEALARNSQNSVADLVNAAVERFLQEANPPADPDLVHVFLKLFRRP